MHKYYYNPYIKMYCVVGTCYSFKDIDGLTGHFGGDLIEVECPDYVNENLGSSWDFGECRLNW